MWLWTQRAELNANIFTTFIVFKTILSQEILDFHWISVLTLVSLRIPPVIAILRFGWAVSRGVAIRFVLCFELSELFDVISHFIPCIFVAALIRRLFDHSLRLQFLSKRASNLKVVLNRWVATAYTSILLTWCWESHIVHWNTEKVGYCAMIIKWGVQCVVLLESYKLIAALQHFYLEYN